MKTEIYAPAKINLRLEVLAKRPDGYHNLRMFNAQVQLYDRIEIKITDSGIKLQCNEKSLPKGEDNLAVKSVIYWQEKFRKNFGVEIKLKKEIPVAAGLGGGSSDAAGILKALCKLFDKDIDELNFEDIAFNLGADVPYLLKPLPAWVEGIGEKLEYVEEEIDDWVYLLVNPGFSVSTKEVFKAYELDSELTILPKKDIFIELRWGNLEKFFQNHLEKVVYKWHPGLARLKLKIRELGAEAVVMSGSGPTLVGVFSDEKSAKEASRILHTIYKDLWTMAVRAHRSIEH